MLSKKTMVYGIVILSMAFWSMTYIWYKIVFEELRPISVMTIRLVFSAGFLLGFSKIIGKLQIPTIKDFAWLLLLSFFQPFLYFLAESYGVSMVSSTIAAVIISTIPIFTPYVAYLFFGDKISVFNTFGIVVSFMGVLMVVLGKDLHFSGSVLGIIILFGAVLAALGYSAIIVRLTNKYNSFTIISWQNLFGAIYFLPLFFFIDWPYFINANFSSKIILNLIYLSFFGSSLAYVLFTYSIKHLGITKASVFTNAIPVFTAAFAYFVLGEILSVFKICGIALVLAGLFMSQKSKQL
ncbi:MAG: DMT family transporter [Salinivirgaceae bacterium]|nr:DMT family transporter [Salinivirgaceae bacterium]